MAVTEVSRHQRRTASGRTTTVRRHHRNTGGGPEYVDADRPAFTPEQASAFAGDPAPPDESWWSAEEQPPEGDWWAGDEPAAATPERPSSPAFDRMAQEMRDRRALGEPELPPWDPADAWLLKADTPEERLSFQRLKAYREAGYTGPLNSENRIPDPDDPANWEWMKAGAALSYG
jgi:hypothetical protein